MMYDIAWKHFAFRILVEVTFGLWVLLALLDGRRRPRLSPILVALSVFTVIIALADLLGVHPERSTWTSFGRMQHELVGLFQYIRRVR